MTSSHVILHVFGYRPQDECNCNCNCKYDNLYCTVSSKLLL